MIKKNRFQKASFRLGKFLDLINAGLASIFALLSAVDHDRYQHWPRLIAKAFEVFDTNAIWAWVLMALLVLVAWLLRLNGDPWIWEKLQSLLSDFQAVAYEAFRGDILDDHRVTLFRYQRCYWCWRFMFGAQEMRYRKGRLPWSGWLVPVLRSGITSQNTNAVFLAPDAGTDAEGVAGRAYASNQICVISGLLNRAGFAGG